MLLNAENTFGFYANANDFMLNYIRVYKAAL